MHKVNAAEAVVGHATIETGLRNTDDVFVAVHDSEYREKHGARISWCGPTLRIENSADGTTFELADGDIVDWVAP